MSFTDPPIPADPNTRREPGAPRLDTTPTDELLEHARFRARRSAAGIGAAVVRSGFTGGEHVWDCAVTDGQAWHYVHVIGRDIGPYPGFSAPEIERAIERFAAKLPRGYRLQGLLNANPLHIDRRGEIED